LLILGLESSCDETAAAVVEDGRRVLFSVVASQVEIHAKFGGVVPEVASRAHAECVSRIIEQALTAAGTPHPSPMPLTPPLSRGEREPERKNVLPMGEGVSHPIPLPPGEGARVREPGTRIPAVDGIAVTVRPGLAGSLLVGTAAASALALAWDLPIVGVHHLSAHAYAPFMAGLCEYPYACLVASGGHTSLYECRAPLDLELLGSTIDDAAGEAFDKAAAVLGLGFPGGPAVSRAAAGGNPKAFDFPRCKLADDDLDFSFSGLKTALLYAVEGPGTRRRDDGARGRRGRGPFSAQAPSPPEGEGRGEGGPKLELTDKTRADLAASFEEAVCEVLVGKLLRAAERRDLPAISIAGGVAANRRLRAMLAERAAEAGVRAVVAPVELCTDNAAMVAGLGFHQLERGEGRGPGRLELAITPELERPARRRGK
jgi:N6-L-threonylcarbamoyladenine synthase